MDIQTRLKFIKKGLEKNKNIINNDATKFDTDSEMNKSLKSVESKIDPCIDSCDNLIREGECKND